MVALLLRNGADVPVGRGWKKFCRESERPPFRIESGNEKRLGELSHLYDVRDFRAVAALEPLRIVVPHRVGLAVDDRRHRLDIEAVALAEDHEVGVEPARLRHRPLLRQLAADHAVGALVVDEERLVTVSLQSTLGALLHPPPLIGADDEDSQGWCRSSGLMTDRSLPESRVLGHDAGGSQAGENESVSTISKPSLQEIHAYEPRRRLEKHRGRRAAAPPGEILLRPPSAVPVELLEILVQRNVRVVEKFIPDFTNRSGGHIDVLVHEIGVVPQLAPEQTDGFVAPPPSVAYLLAEKEIAPRNAKGTGAARFTDNAADLLRQLRRAALVRIEDKDPRGLRPLDRVITRRADRRELRAEHGRPGTARAIYRIVRRIILDDDHLASPFDARDAGLYVRGFIVSRDHRRYVGGTAVGGAHPWRRPFVRALLAARSNPSIIWLSGNSLATLVRAAFPIVSRASSLVSIPATAAAVEAESSGG